MQLALLLQTAAYTASRPGALVDSGRKNSGEESYDDESDKDCEEQSRTLCYEDITLLLLPNPTPGERDVLVIEVTLAHTKGEERQPKP